MGAWIVDRVIALLKVINTDHLSIDFKALGFANGDV